MSDAAERAWQEWRTKTSPEYKRWGIGDVERAFLAGWAAREAIELEMAKADATEIATLIARRIMVETELTQARKLLRQALYQVCEVEGWDVPWWAEKWAPAVDTFLEATDGSADRG